jgi:cell division transport system permease protein
VAQVTLVTPEQALERFRTSLGGGELLEGVEGNPLPASLELELDESSRTTEGIAVVAASLDGLSGVDELAHGQEWIEGYARALGLARSGGTLLGVVLAGAALLIVANTIRLAVYAREDEIEILTLVGAGRLFLRTPFLLEGALQGALGGALALLLLYVAFRSWLPQIELGLAMFLGQSAPRFFAGADALGLVAVGAALGLAGSAFAMLGWRR